MGERPPLAPRGDNPRPSSGVFCRREYYIAGTACGLEHIQKLHRILLRNLKMKNSLGVFRFGQLCKDQLTAAAGVRQGCPLSPPLFALIMDAFIEYVHLWFPDLELWAYADDIAIIIRSNAGLGWSSMKTTCSSGSLLAPSASGCSRCVPSCELARVSAR